MLTIQNINIPKPCHQSWQQMTPAETGRHCAQCCKTVTDFTTMTNSQVIAYLSNTNNICGRFNEQQLNNLNRQFYVDRLTTTGGWKRVALILGFVSSALSFKAAAQNRSVITEQGPKAVGDAAVGSFMLGKVVQTDSVKTRIITGRICDDQNAPMPGVTIKMLSGITGATTDMRGKFTLTIPTDTKQLQVLFIGYKPLSIDICTDSNYRIKLTTEQYAWMGEIVVTRTPLIKRIYYRCIKRPIRKIFN